MDDVMMMPVRAKKTRNRFFAVPLSAMAPSAGDARAMMMPEREFPMPSRAVLTVGSMPAHQYCLKKMGKNPAITVVAKAEFAQS